MTIEQNKYSCSTVLWRHLKNEHRKEYNELRAQEVSDGYFVAYKPITFPCILLMFIEMKFIHCHSCVMFAMKSMSMCND